MSTVVDAVKAKARAYTTEQILNAIALYDVTSEATLDQDSRLVRAALSDVLCERFPAVDALMEKWYADETDAGLDFTANNSYTTLILKAYDMTEGK